MNRSTTTRTLPVILAAVLLVTACGGSGDQAGTDPDADPGSGAVATSEAPQETPAGDGSEEPGGETEPGAGPDANKAVVTIGDERFEFDVEQSIVGRCEPDFYGAFWVIAASSDGSGGGLEMLLIPEGSQITDETSKVKVDVTDAAGREWRADEDGGEGTPEGESKVGSFSIEGGSVSGTASFVDIEAGDGATAEGSFEATCPEG